MNRKDQMRAANAPKPRVGFVGLGVMGAPMARHLAEAGYAVAMSDTAPGRASGLAEKTKGAEAFETAREVGQRSDIVVTMLPNGRVVQDVVFGADGLAQGMRRGSLLLDTSSSEPWLSRETAKRLGEQDVSMVDAPVSGAVVGAEAAELVFMVGASAADLERVRPLLDVMGRKAFHLGGLGAGDTMKCLNNLVTAITLTATAEALVTGTKAGLDPAAMTDVLNESTGGSWCSRSLIHQRVLNRTFNDPFKLELMLKDMGIALDLARGLELPMMLGGASHQLWQAASLAQGKGASVIEMVRWVEKMMNGEIRTSEMADRST
jgi:3-hydroxyisobutyrate dehydrogenase